MNVVILYVVSHVFHFTQGSELKKKCQERVFGHFGAVRRGLLFESPYLRVLRLIPSLRQRIDIFSQMHPSYRLEFCKNCAFCSSGFLFECDGN
jgi:hypothetical protein